MENVCITYLVPLKELLDISKFSEKEEMTYGWELEE